MIERDISKKIIQFGQEKYVTDILVDFDMSSVVLVVTPMAAKHALDVNSNQLLDQQTFPFLSLVGKLMYCSNRTRPDIMTVVNHLNRYMSSPTVSHWAQAKRILRYLNGTRSFCVTFNGIISLDPIVWQDSSFGDGDIRRSKTGSKDEDVLNLMTCPPDLLVRRCGLIWLPNFQELAAVQVSPTISRDLIHRRCGHLHETGLKKIDKLGIDGIWGYSLLPPFSFCTYFDIAKPKVAKFNR